MNEPSAAEQRVIFLLFPDLADRVFAPDWDHLEFSVDSQAQIRDVLKALAVERDEGWTEGYAAGHNDAGGVA